MAGCEETFTDPDGQRIDIRESRDHAPGAYLVPVDLRGLGWAIPAHRLAGFTGYLYRAAGQPVPDLPVIHDPRMVAQLTDDIARIRDMEDESKSIALGLLDCGWRKS